MRLRLSAFLVASMFLSACGETTSTGLTTPPPAPPPILSPGPRILTLLGNLGGVNTFPQPCGPAPGSPGGAFVETRVDIELQNGDLVARSLAPGDGNLVITFHPDSGDTPNERRVSATFSGTAVDLIPSLESVARSAIPDVSGASDQAIFGFVYGGVTFSGTKGVTVACDQVFWTLILYPTFDRAP
jgi:hypothetical protein